ncbi:hypothetical protein [Psychromonas sp. Urea-02u-13]|uniref:hypothetical protein n=1 Tax=Psychromonas sp. Urea-02u-13 TaxID=2058326 RepID=UPI000C348515|nr:hypothetical protein [Psychromonas sp. Urea-02u-13]PKG37028.1 hypothetical protein CXF74_21050 [Psychromonas sp. Urea-02u-13]
MQKYADINNDSGVDSFEIHATSITVWFDGAPKSYTYSYGIAGSQHVEEMKKRALVGDGLNAYINMNVKFKYDR